MKLALISDIHGNTVALDAVIADMGSVDAVVCLGDIAAGGPDPGGAVDRIAEIAAVSVQGNTDVGLVDIPGWWRDPMSMGLPEEAVPGLEICVWGEQRLSSTQLRYLDRLPLTDEVSIGDVGMLAFHGSPVSADDIITASTPPDELDSMLGGAAHAWLAGGHTHVEMLRRHGHQMLVNPGGVGMPFAAYGSAGSVSVLRHAAYALVSVRGGAVDVEFRHVPVDEAALARSCQQAGMPRADWWLGLRRP